MSYKSCGRGHTGGCPHQRSSLRGSPARRLCLPREERVWLDVQHDMGLPKLYMLPTVSWDWGQWEGMQEEWDSDPVGWWISKELRWMSTNQPWVIRSWGKTEVTVDGLWWAGQKPLSSEGAGGSYGSPRMGRTFGAGALGRQESGLQRREQSAGPVPWQVLTVPTIFSLNYETSPSALLCYPDSVTLEIQVN